MACGCKNKKSGANAQGCKGPNCGPKQTASTHSVGKNHKVQSKSTTPMKRR